MIPIPTTTRPARRLRFEIRDILAVVVGYGMAAVWLLLTWPVAWGCLVAVGQGLRRSDGKGPIPGKLSRAKRERRCR